MYRAGADYKDTMDNGAMHGSNSGSGGFRGGDVNFANIYFDANDNYKNYGNAMAGHANGTDIHPYNISFLPLIAY